MLNKLKPLFVQRVKHADKLAANGKPSKSSVRYSDGSGLYLSVSPAGTKSWLFIWSKNKKRREAGLGSYPAISLAKARELAADFREQVAHGLDPIAERNQVEVMTFKAVAEQCIEATKGDWSNERHIEQWSHALFVIAKPLANIPIDQITIEDVVKVLAPIWLETHITAARVRSRIAHVLDYAEGNGLRSGDNPASLNRMKFRLPKIKKQEKVVKHHPAMEYKDLPAFIVDLHNRPAMASLALEFLILTACRTSEVLNTVWSEIDLEAAVWTIPAERMKMSTEHRVPLSARALEILQGLHELRRSDFVFQGQKRGKPLGSMSMAMLIRRMKVEGVTVHGFRSSFRDWAGDKTSFPREIAEAALAHSVGNAVERAYRRSDALEKRRRLMQAWADYCAGASAGAENVVPIRA